MIQVIPKHIEEKARNYIHSL